MLMILPPELLWPCGSDIGVIHEHIRAVDALAEDKVGAALIVAAAKERHTSAIAIRPQIVPHARGCEDDLHGLRVVMIGDRMLHLALALAPRNVPEQAGAAIERPWYRREIHWAQIGRRATACMRKV